MLLQSDIKINEYAIASGKVSEKELKQKNLLFQLSVFQDEIESAIMDINNHSVYYSYAFVSTQKKFSNNELLLLINDLLTRYHLQQYNLKEIRIIYSSSHFVLCPEEFYLSDKKNLLLNFVHPVSADEIILNNSFENIKIIFSIPSNIHQNLLQIFPSAHLLHSSASMLNIFYHHPFLLHSKIWAHIHPNYIEVVAKDNKQLLFYNTFEVQNSLDILYYLLFCMQQLKFDPKETDLFVSGNLSLQHTVFQLLQKYVHSVHLIHHHPKLHILPIDAALISHHHFITLNHYLCESFQANTKAEK